MVAGLHVPVMLFVDIAGSSGAAAPEQIGLIVPNNGVIELATVTVMVTGIAHWPALGVNV